MITRTKTALILLGLALLYNAQKKRIPVFQAWVNKRKSGCWPAELE